LWLLLSVVIITWLHIFAHALVIISAGTLVKLDAQTAGLSEKANLFGFCRLSLVGLGLE